MGKIKLTLDDKCVITGIEGEESDVRAFYKNHLCNSVPENLEEDRVLEQNHLCNPVSENLEEDQQLLEQKDAKETEIARRLNRIKKTEYEGHSLLDHDFRESLKLKPGNKQLNIKDSLLLQDNPCKTEDQLTSNEMMLFRSNAPTCLRQLPRSKSAANPALFNKYHLNVNGGYYCVDQNINDFYDDAITIAESGIELDFKNNSKILSPLGFNNHRDAIQLHTTSKNPYAGGYISDVTIKNAKIVESAQNHFLHGVTGFDGVYDRVKIKDTIINSSHQNGLVFNGLLSGEFENVSLQNGAKAELNPIRLGGGVLNLFILEPFIELNNNQEHLMSYYQDSSQYGINGPFNDNRTAFTYRDHDGSVTQRFYNKVSGYSNALVMTHFNLYDFHYRVSISPLLNQQSGGNASQQKLNKIREIALLCGSPLLEINGNVEHWRSPGGT